jgi:hypothetical protein
MSSNMYYTMPVDKRRPMDKIMQNGELFTMILSHVDPDTLLISCQGVNRQWRDTIQDCSELQRKLFFKPSLPSSPGANVEYRLNPFLPRFYIPLLEAHKRQQTRQQVLDDPDWAAPKVVYGSEMQHRILEATREHLARDVFEANAHAAVDAKLLRPEASWRRMMVRDPPVWTLGFVDDHSRSDYPPMQPADGTGSSSGFHEESKVYRGYQVFEYPKDDELGMTMADVLNLKYGAGRAFEYNRYHNIILWEFLAGGLRTKWTDWRQRDATGKVLKLHWSPLSGVPCFKRAGREDEDEDDSEDEDEDEEEEEDKDGQDGYADRVDGYIESVRREGYPNFPAWELDPREVVDGEEESSGEWMREE